MKKPIGTKNRLAVLGLMLLGSALVGTAAAQAVATAPPPTSEIFDAITKTYLSKAQGWETLARGYALSLFGMTAVISMAWTGIKFALARKEFEGLIGVIAKQFLTLGFFLLLVEKGPDTANLIINSFSKAGSAISGVGELSASRVVALGFDAMFRIMAAIGDMGWGDTAAFGLPLALAGMIILFSFTAIAILLALTVIESYFVIYGGIIMLGFGGLPWTRDIPKNYLTYAINVGVRLFVLYLILGVGLDQAATWPSAIATTGDGGTIMHNVFFVCVAALFFAVVAWKAPSIAGALTSGSVNMSASDGLGVAAAAVGGAAGVTGLAAAVGSGAVGAAGSTSRGLAQAAIAGVGLAKEQGASGLSAAVKGLRHAGGASMAEAGTSVASRLGLKPRSANAVDGRGQDIGNLGTRAANNLAGKTQALKETNAAAPLSSAGGSSAANAATSSVGGADAPAAASTDPGTKLAGGKYTPGAGTGRTAGGGSVSTPGGDATSAASPAATAAAPGTPAIPTEPLRGGASPDAPPLHAAVEDKGASLGDAVRNAAPPPLPADGGGGGVSINLHSGHDD